MSNNPNEPGRGVIGRVVDLSVTLSPELPCAWPNAVPFRHFVDHWFEDVTDPVEPRHCFNSAPYASYAWIIDEHTGTHFDAPSHFLPPEAAEGDSGGPLTGDKVDPAQFIGPAAVIDVTALRSEGTAAGTSPRIESEHVQKWEATHGELDHGDVVLFASGWDEHYRPVTDEGSRYVVDPIVRRSGSAWPAPSPNCMRYLIERGIRCIGTDGASMGPADDGAPTHVVGLSAGAVFVECLTGLLELPPRGATFVFLPVKVARSSGGPGRAIALL